MVIHGHGFLLGQKIGMLARIIATAAIYQKVGRGFRGGRKGRRREGGVKEGERERGKGGRKKGNWLGGGGEGRKETVREGGFQFAKVDLLMVFVTLIGLTLEGGGGGSVC